jgi:hypothetical protein
MPWLLPSRDDTHTFCEYTERVRFAGMLWAETWSGQPEPGSRLRQIAAE